MKTIEIKLYKFEELTEEQQKKAIENYWDINVDHQWWEYIFEDAEMVGIKINAFDIISGNFCDIDNIWDCKEIAEEITKNHGEQCDTYIAAKEFIKERSKLVEKYSDGVNLVIVDYENEAEFNNECDELERDFICELSECYLSMLRKEYEWLTSEKQIKETIIANDYDFTEDSKIY